MRHRPIEFQVLGPTEARQGGKAIPLSGARRRALVTRLLLDAGRAVSADALLEDVWGDEAPAAALATLQSHVSATESARRPPGANHGWLRLRLDGASVDAPEFEGVAATALRSSGKADFEAAAWTLRQRSFCGEVGPCRRSPTAVGPARGRATGRTQEVGGRTAS